MSHHLLTPRICVSSKLEQKLRSWNSNQVLQNGNEGIPIELTLMPQYPHFEVQHGYKLSSEMKLLCNCFTQENERVTIIHSHATYTEYCGCKCTRLGESLVGASSSLPGSYIIWRCHTTLGFVSSTFEGIKILSSC